MAINSEAALIRKQFKLITKLAIVLTANTDFDKQMNRILRQLGSYTKVDRVYIFEDSWDGHFTSNKYEWVSKGTKAEIDNLQNMPYTEMSQLKRAIGANDVLRARDIKELDKDLFEVLNAQSIKSVLIFPLICGLNKTGFIGFDVTREYREWNDDDVDLLKTVSGIVSNTYLRREAEQRVINHERYLRSAVEATNVGIWDWNIVTGEVVFNEQWAQIIGYSLKELEPVSFELWKSKLDPDDWLLAKKNLKDYINKKIDSYQFECRMKHKNGDWVWVLVKGKIIEWDENAKPVRMTGTHLDINEVKRKDTALKETIKDLEQLNKYMVGRELKMVELKERIKELEGMKG